MKRIALLVLVTLFASGCSFTSQWGKKVNEVVDDVKSMDILNGDQMSDELKEELLAKRDEIRDDLFDALEIDSDFSSNKEYETLRKNLIMLQSSLKYKMKNVELNEDKTIANLTLNVDYVSIEDIFSDVMNDNLDRSVLKMSSGESAELFIKDVLLDVNESIDNINIDNSMKSENISVIFEEVEGEWLMVSVDEKALGVFTLGMSKYMNLDLQDKLEEVKINRTFLEIESRFNMIAEELGKSLSSKKSLYGDFSEEDKKKLSNELSNEIEVDVLLVNSVGKKENIYYTTQGEKPDEIDISVIFNGDKYSVTKSIVNQK